MLRIIVVLVGLVAIVIFALREGNPVVAHFFAIEVSKAVREANQLLVGVEISRLLEDGNQYDGRLITVRGVVVGTAAVMGLGGYRLRQGDSELLVVSKRGTPRIGIEATVTGTFKQALVVGSYQAGVIFEK